MKNYIFYDYIYDEKEIESLIDLCQKQDVWHRINDSPDSNEGNRYYMKPTKYLCPDKLISTYLNFLPIHSSESMKIGLILSNGYTPDVKISKYEKSDQYNWHCDYWESHEETKYWRRQISSITYLNDDYLGGETEFECGVVIKPETGKTVIFPSTWSFPHRGRIVTEGVKYIYVKHIWV